MTKDKIFQELTNTIIKSDLQGYALYLKIGNDIEERVQGYRLEGSLELNDFDTYFRLASVSKQFIAFAIVDLVLNNKLSFDTTIKNIYPTLPNYFNNITIKNLLNHTSGIYDYEDIEHLETDHPILDRDIISFLEQTDTTYFEIGKEYRYSNTAYVLLGLIVEDIYQKPLGVALKEIIFDKAGMKHSCANYEGKTTIPNRAYGHILEDNKLIKKDQSWTSYTIGDGGIYSSINELKLWIEFLSKSPHSKYMFVPNILDNGTNTEYGMGIRKIEVKGRDMLYHCGNTIGTNTILFFSKDLNIQMIFLTNLANINTTQMKTNFVEILNKIL